MRRAVCGLRTSKTNWAAPRSLAARSAGSQTRTLSGFDASVPPISDGPEKQGAMSAFNSRAVVKIGRESDEFAQKTIEEFGKFQEAAAAAGKPIRLMAGAVIERLPVILCDLEDFEKDFLVLQQEQRLKKEKLYPKSEFIMDTKVRRDEIWAYEQLGLQTDGKLGPLAFDEDVQRQIAELKKEVHGAEDTKQAPDSSDSETGVESNEGKESEDKVRNLKIVDDDKADDIQWAFDMDEKAMEANHEASDSFRPEPRITEADINGDWRSLRRRLQRRLHLIVKVHDPAFGGAPQGDAVWRFPMAARESDSEKLLDCASRAVKDQVGEMDIYYLAHIPTGFHAIPYQGDAASEFYGAHVLMYRGQRIGGDVAIQTKDVLDYAWITNDEIELFVPDYLNDPYWSQAYMYLDD